MSQIKAGVVVVTKFCKSSSGAFSSYINYIDRDEAIRTENTSKYNLYQDYMGNPEKTSGLFTEQKNIKLQREKEELKEVFKMAYDKGSLMWQTVISFDNRWLEKNGLYNSQDKILDEEKIKDITKSAVNKMLEKEGLSSAMWSAAIHYNTDNIHVHVATVELEPMREMKDYVQYHYKKENGKYVRLGPVLDNQGKPIIKKEYKGTFRQSSIEGCRREIVNQIINEKDNNLKINYIIRDSIVKQKREHPLARDKELCNLFLSLYKKMPDCNRNMWNYNNPIINPLKKEIDNISNNYLEKYHVRELDELHQRLLIQEEKYKESYGDTNRSYVKTKMDDLYTRLGNAILKEIREYDKECKKNDEHISILDIEEMIQKEVVLGQNIKEAKNDFSCKKELEENLLLKGEMTEKEINVSQEKDELRNEKSDIGNSFYCPEGDVRMEWSRAYKVAKKLIHQIKPEYEKAIFLLEQEHRAGNILATYELGDVYQYGRGKEINQEESQAYYKCAFNGFYKIFNSTSETSEDMWSKNYSAYRLGKMYYYGLGIEQNYENARKMFETSKNEYSIYMLGKMAYNGQAMEQDYEKAYSYFKKVSEDIPYAAYQAAAMIDNGKKEETIEKMNSLYSRALHDFLELEKTQEDDNLEYRIGCMYMQGKGTEQDFERAEFYFSKSAEAGNLYSKNKLAMLYLKQNRLDMLPEIVATLKEVADKTDNIWSMYALGNIYSFDKYGVKNYKEAISWYNKAEKDGNEFISYRLGKIYLDKQNEYYNEAKAKVHFERALKEGSSLAGYQLGKMAYNGQAMKQDYRKAYNYFEKVSNDNPYAAYQAASMIEHREIIDSEEKMNDLYKDAFHQFLKMEETQEDDSVEYRIGCMYFEGKGINKNERRAELYLLKSAEKGNMAAIQKLGNVYLKKENWVKAIEYLSKSDDMYSHYKLGKIYMDKKNKFFDLDKGMKHMKISAQKGSSFAELSLGILYLKGEIVPRDMTEAENWVSKAAEHGNEFARAMLKDWNKKTSSYIKVHIIKGMSLYTAIVKMKKGLKSEWEKNRLQREHEQMIEQCIDE